MYNPDEANKSYSLLFKENGMQATFQSLVFIACWYATNIFIFSTYTPIPILIGGYIFFLVYFTWKPKLIRFLRGVLRGKEFRDKCD